MLPPASTTPLSGTTTILSDLPQTPPRLCAVCRGELTGPRNLTRHRECAAVGKLHQKRGTRKSRRLRFVGIDGEGVTTCTKCRRHLPDPPAGSAPEVKPPTCRCGNDVWRHDYVLLTIGDTEPLQAADGLSALKWWDIFRYVYDYQVQNPDACLVGFYLGYDFTQWFRTLPEERARMLITTEGQIKRRRSRSGGNNVPFPVYTRDPDGVEWEYDYLPGRRFKVRPSGEKLWAYVCDTGSFWQSSFLKAIDPKAWPKPMCKPEEYALIRKGKESRGGAALNEDMRVYNALENDILARITRELDEAFRSADITLNRNQWFGPGQVAQKWLSNQGLITAKRLEEVVPGEFLQAAARTYYGGWFNIPVHGRVKELEEWDINSAYPYAMTKLPCLEHGRYTMGDGSTPPPSTPWVILECDVRSPDRYIGAGLMCRNVDGSIHTPQNVKGWYWLPEVLASLRATRNTFNNVKVSRWWAYEPCDCKPPLRGLEGLYQKRLRVGKNSPEGKALKLIYNSCYGKLAQSIGEPKFANAIYASLITSTCRTMILDSIAMHPEGSKAVAMIATDGIYFMTPHPKLIPEAERLGGWDRSVKKNVTLFKPGVYWDDKARDAIRDGADSLPLKSRGVNARALSLHIDAIDVQFEMLRDGTSDQWPTVEIPIPFGIVTPALALARGKWETCGRIILNDRRDESSFPGQKRDPAFFVDGERDVIRTWVHRDGGVTAAYRKFTPDAVPVDLDGVAADRWFTDVIHP